MYQTVAEADDIGVMVSAEYTRHRSARVGNTDFRVLASGYRKLMLRGIKHISLSRTDLDPVMLTGRQIVYSNGTVRSGGVCALKCAVSFIKVKSDRRSACHCLVLTIQSYILKDIFNAVFAWAMCLPCSVRAIEALRILEKSGLSIFAQPVFLSGIILRVRLLTTRNRAVVLCS